MPARVFSVQQGELVALLGSIHPFPSKEFFSPSAVFLLAFFTLSFFILFPVHLYPRGGGGCISCPAPLPAARPPLAGGQGAAPVRWLLPAAFSPCPCPAVLWRWPPALGKLIWPRRWLRGRAECLSQRQAASTPGRCWDPLPHSTCAERRVYWLAALVCLQAQPRRKA